MSVASSTTPGIGTEFVRDAFDANRRDGGAFDGAQQHAAETGADGGPESALERLRREHAETLGERFRIGDKTFRFLESFEHSLILSSSISRIVTYFEYNSTMSCSFNWI